MLILIRPQSPTDKQEVAWTLNYSTVSRLGNKWSRLRPERT